MSNVAFGYLSVLLSNLCMDGVIRKHVRSQLAGGTLNPLLNAVEEFVHYHRQVDEEIHEVGGTEDSRAGLVGRLQSVVDRLKAEEGRSAG